MITFNLDDEEGMNLLIECLKKNKGESAKEAIEKEFAGSKYDVPFGNS